MKNLARGYLRGLQLKCCTEHDNVSEGKSQLISRPARRRYESGCNQARQNAPGDAQQRLELAYRDVVLIAFACHLRARSLAGIGGAFSARWAGFFVRAGVVAMSSPASLLWRTVFALAPPFAR